MLSLESHIAPRTVAASGAAAAAATVYGDVKQTCCFVRTRTCLSSLKGGLSKSIKMQNAGAGCSVRAGQRGGSVGERRVLSLSSSIKFCRREIVTPGRSDTEETEEKRKEHPERHTLASVSAAPRGPIGALGTGVRSG